MSLEFGRRLQLYRSNCEFTQKNIADALNIDRSTYAYYERGTTEPDLRTLVKIAKILNVTTSHLIPLEDETEEVTVADIRLSKEQKVRGKDADAKTSKVYNLSKGEKELLAIYRAMDKEKREALTVHAKDMVKK